MTFMSVWWQKLQVSSCQFLFTEPQITGLSEHENLNLF